ncbi:hypothetical protein B0H19DRAFT_950883, partial [Mycena capillaripes]
STNKKLRRDKLEEIYKIFATMDKGTPEYTKLASSGLVWEEYARPGNIADFRRVQDGLKDGLRDLNELREVAARKMSLSAMAGTLLPAVAHQSVAFEDNPLTLGDANNMHDRLFSNLDTPLHEQPNPPSHDVLPQTTVDAGTWLSDTPSARGAAAERRPQRCRRAAQPAIPIPVSRRERHAHSLLTGPGPTRLARHPHDVVPGSLSSPFHDQYPEEVPALMERLLLWRQETHARAVLHPLIFAARYETNFTAIHPFPDGNGRAGHLLAGFCLVQNGFLPTSYHNLDRHEVHKGRPDYLCSAMLEAQRHTLSAFLSSSGLDKTPSF